jgi:type II secretory pathway pseudopilin PulG
MKARHGLRGQGGISLIEVLVAALVLGIALTGLTLLLSRGQTAVVAQGDTRVALYLAQQKIERLRGLGFGAAAVFNQDNSGCGLAGQNNEPCYNETLTAGEGDTQSFTRLTCVRWVRDDNPELPADPPSGPYYTGGDNRDAPPASWACPSCTAGDPATDPGNCGPTNDTSCCTHQTKRIKVVVIPLLPGGTDTSRPIDPVRIVLSDVLTPIPKP